MPSYTTDKRQILLRLRKMEGQLKGIQKMVEEDKYCVDVLNQLNSIMAATQKVAATDGIKLVVKRVGSETGVKTK